MDDATWDYDLMPLLQQAHLGEPAELLAFVARFAPMAATNADYSKLLVLRSFRATPGSGDGRHTVYNGRPVEADFQPGITVVTASASGGAMSNVYLPTGATYTGLRLQGQEVEIGRANAPTVVTNTIELHRKLNFWLTFAEADLQAAFARLCNEHYPPPPVVSAPSELRVKLPGAGRLTYNARFDWYEGSCRVAGRPVALSVAHVPAPQQAALLSLVAQQLRARFYQPLLAAMTDELLLLKNDTWLDEEEGETEVSRSEFERRVTLSDILFSDDHTVTLYCDDDDLFFGHTIEIKADAHGRFVRADLAG